jgi:hypothetical protein
MIDQPNKEHEGYNMHLFTQEGKFWKNWGGKNLRG